MSKVFSKSPFEVKEKCRNASFVKDIRFVFNIYGNKYRLMLRFTFIFRPYF
ncbi:type II toxin-antitoxin system HigB family toxin [Leptospira biflexa]|uniref:type II toxin-antitoxin system HigB family toxin n=1 Tax=Leptospira biflexa TaxID=172 RepID=UPI003CD0D547